MPCLGLISVLWVNTLCTFLHLLPLVAAASHSEMTVTETVTYKFGQNDTIPVQL